MTIESFLLWQSNAVIGQLLRLLRASLQIRMVNNIEVLSNNRLRNHIVSVAHAYNGSRRLW